MAKVTILQLICIKINKHRMIIYKNIGKDNIRKPFVYLRLYGLKTCFRHEWSLH